MRTALGTALLLVVTTVVYLPALSYDYVYEDHTDPDTFFRPMGIAEIWAQPARSLTRLSFTVTHAVSLNPWADHLASVIVHLVNIWLLLGLVRRMVEPSWALFLAGLFALHPINVEAVVYISARPDLLAVTGLLLALHAVARGWCLAAGIGIVAACLAKETAVVTVVLVPLWAWWTDAPIAWRRWRWGLLAVALVVLWVAWGRGHALQSSPLWVGAQLSQTASLLGLVLWPAGSTIDHDWLWIGPERSALMVGLVSGMTTTALSVGVPLRSSWAFAWLWCLVCIAPRLIVRLYEGQHEHHMYPLTIGLCLSVGHWLGTRHVAKEVPTWA